MPNRLTPAGIALVYAAFAALWIVASGYLLTLTVNAPLLQSRLELAKGLVFVAVTSGLLYLLLKGWREPLVVATSVQEDDTRPPETRRLLLFIALALVVPLIGLAIVKLHGPQIEREAYSNLEAITRLKAEQIENWLAERHADGVTLAAGTGLAAQIDQFVQQDAKLSQRILDQFDTLRTAYGYESILLLDAGGRLLLASGEHADITSVLQNLLRQSLASKQVQRSNLYRSEFGHVHLDWVVPVVVSGPQGERQVAAIVLRAVPERFLYPLIQTWPTTSASAETLLVRREGESAIYLNELRHHKGTALTLRTSLATSLPGAVAMREEKPGTMQGKDYRGVPVLAAYRPVAGTDWRIVAKIDRGEVLAPLHELAFWVSLVAFAAIAVIMLALLLLWRQQRRAHSLALLARSAAVIKESEQRFRAVAQSANDAIVTADSSGNIVGWNASAERLFGYTAAEINGQALTRLMPERFRAPHREGLARVTAGGAPHVIGKSVELAGQRKDGSEFPLELSLAQWQTTEGNFFTTIIRDITERKQAEDALRDSRENLYRLLNSMAEGAYGVDTDGNCTFVNQAFLKILGYQNDDEVLGKHIHALIHHSHADGSPYPASECKMYRAYKTNQSISVSDEVFWRKDGVAIPIEYRSHPILIDGVMAGAIATFVDITKRKAAEAKIQRLTQLYGALSQCNQAIVRSDSEEVLFPQICRDAVQFGGMKMAWVGIVDPVTRMVHPAASFGEGAGAYLQDIEISVDAGSPFGRGATGTAIRENQPFWCQDFLNDPCTAPWHERGVRFGWGAAASLPLYRSGAVIGAFTLYAGEANAFDEAARNLLVEMATDISFALNNFARDAQLKLAAKVFEQSSEGFIITDANHNIILVNHAFTVISGYSEAEALGQNPRMLASDRHNRDFFRAMWDAIDTQGQWQGEVWNRRKDGSLYPEWLSIIRVLDANGKVAEYIGTFTDITQRKEGEERIQRLAHFDPLTGLPNRAFLTDRINYAISMAQRSHAQLAILFLDLDHFKNVNDTLGHRIGDELLIEVAKRLKSAVREEDTVSRQGGDEFILVLPGTTADGAAHVADKLLEAVAQPYQIEQHELVVTLSIGIAMYPSDGEDFESLSRSADVAMYRAKKDGRNNYRFFTPEMQAHSARRMQLENAMRHALERDQLRLHYQPQVSLADGCIIGAEALLRWQHPELGMVSPAEFIPIAESSGQILQIGEWVLRSAVQQLRAWMDSGLVPMVIAVNLSAVQFRHPHLPELVTRILDEAKLPPQYLELELTEGVAMDDPLAAIAVMDNLHARGIRMSIDDFGTGYSSLSYLKRFKIYKLKIDQSFVRDITTNPEDKAIVSAIISLANSLGMQTIAEGVETEGQLAFLREKSCDEVQGYYFSKPLPVDQFEAFVRGMSQQGAGPLLHDLINPDAIDTA